MTKIQKIQMKGFKSFANKTELLFGDKFNCILGPNGSGKSNVIDALCFVLGKSSAKEMRAEKSANLIYNGGKTKKPAKEGEVSLFFDNKSKVFPIEADSIKITRIITQSGQSKYKINDKNRTRQQIIDLLSHANINPDGYNIILQGDIVRLVEMTPLERRGIVEEIAGISIYEEKKEKALRELTKVEEKLNEAAIILTERETYLQELKKERNQAKKFKELDDNIKRNKATILSARMKEKQDKIAGLEKSIADNTKGIEKIRKEIDDLKKKMAEQKKKIEDINKEVEKRGEKEQVTVHKEVEEIKVQLALNNQRIATLNQELQKITDRKKDLEKTHEELTSKIAILDKSKKDIQKQIEQKEKDVKKIDSQIDAFNKKHKLADAHEIDKQIEQLDKKAEKAQEEIQQLREKQQNLLRDKDKLEVRISSIDEKIEKVLSISKENKQALDGLKKKKDNFKNATSELNKCLTEDSSLASQLSNARSKLLSRKEELAKHQAKTAGLRESIAGDVAIKKILELKSKEKGIYGTISELGNVSSEYALALEVAAGNRIKSIIVDDDDTAAKCIKYLKENKFGVATFLPLNKIKAPIIDAEKRNMKGAGIHGLALDFVSFDKKFEKAFQYVLRDTIIVDSVDVARRIGIGKARMVTLTGDLIETSGAMQGGFRQKQRGIGFQEVEVTSAIEKLEKEINDMENVVSSLELKKKENEAAIDRLRNLKAELEADIIKTEKSLHLDSTDLDVSKQEKNKISGELKEIEKKLETTQQEVSVKNKELADMKIEKQALRDKINAMRNPEFLAELNSFEDKKKELKEEITNLQIEIKNADSEVKNILGPEGENVLKILKQHDKERGDFEKEKKEVQDLIKQQEKSLKDKEEAEKKFYQQFKGLFNERTKISEEVAKSETQVSNKDEKIRDIETKNNGISLENAKTKAELAGIEEEYKAYEGVQVFKDKDEELIQKEIRQFENMLENLGAVNMKALEIYEKAEQEYDELIKKKEKLTKEREDVLVMINEIDSKKKDLFMKTFDVLTQNFKNLFARLSAKGEAYLQLEDENDPFNGGVLIKVRLSGKKFLDIRSLSGGEKTMTALAFIFAVQEHEPASFYILDEVDAALDKRNSEKLANLVSSYSEKAQYIMISHNDGVITSADNLYGVSMNEFGMSKVTSLKI